MVRSYKRKPGSRSYANYKPETLDLAVALIKSRKLSFRAAQERFNIPLGTLYNKLKGKHTNSIGRQTALTNVEESSIVKNAQALSSWGFPLDIVDIRKLVKYYLAKSGKVVTEFKNNYPSADWALGFLKRHKNEITLRICQNIKKIELLCQQK